MLAFIIKNLSTIIISILLLSLIVWISYGLIKKKREGKSIGCGGGCSGCPCSASCKKH